MHALQAVAAAAALFAALAAGAALPRALPSGTVTCGSHKFSVSAVSAATSAGAKDLSSGNDPDGYPHQFFNYEGLKLWCSGSGPWYEFPILSGGSIFKSGSPGADRVVFTGSGTYCAVVTHTGASETNGFVSCAND